jgi:hypothetical protein
VQGIFKKVNIDLVVLCQLTTVNILLFVRYPKKRSRIGIRKSYEGQIGFLKNFKSIFHGAEMGFVSTKG